MKGVSLIAKRASLLCCFLSVEMTMLRNGQIDYCDAHVVGSVDLMRAKSTPWSSYWYRDQTRGRR